TARCWGKNDAGQLGDGTTDQRTTPVTVTGLTGATDIVAGHSHSCAIRTDQTGRCWGHNGFGQLGNGNHANSSTPVTVAGLGGATAATVGIVHSCAQLIEGAVR